MQLRKHQHGMKMSIGNNRNLHRSEILAIMPQMHRFDIR